MDNESAPSMGKQLLRMGQLIQGLLAGPTALLLVAMCFVDLFGTPVMDAYEFV
jgi:hypothetical protein